MGLIKSLSLGIGVDNKRLKKGLRSSTKQVTSWTASIGKIATGTALGNLAGGAISSTIGTIRTNLESAFNFAVRDEQLETAFGTLLGGAAKAKAVLADLRQFGASTPFEFPGIADSAKKLISFGFSQEQLLPSLTRLGDVAAGLDIPFSDLADIYGKARVAGKIMTEDVNQLAGRGIPIFDELAKVLGTSAGEIKDLASKGQIDFGHLEQAFANMTGEGGKFSGMMAAQSKTAGGLISTLKDNINLQLGQIGAAMFKVFDIKGLIGKAIGFIQGMQPTFDWLVGQAVQLRPIFQQTFNVVGSVFMAMWQAASGVFSAIGAIFGSFGSITLQGFVQGVVRGLATVEYAFLNWQKVGSLAIKTILHRMIEFGNEVTHIFTIALPYVVNWWTRQGTRSIAAMAANAMQMFKNLSGNIVSIFANLPGLISGSTSFNDILQPLNRGLLNTVEEAFEIPQRLEGGIERTLRGDLERLQNDIGEGLSVHVQKRLGELIPESTGEGLDLKPPELPKPGPIAIDGAGGLGTDVAQQFAGLAEAGSQEYRDAILRFRGLGGDDQDVAKEARDIAKQQLEQQRETNQLLAGQAPQKVFSIPGG